MFRRMFFSNRLVILWIGIGLFTGLIGDIDKGFAHGRLLKHRDKKRSFRKKSKLFVDENEITVMQAKTFYIEGKYEKAFAIIKQFLMKHGNHADLDEAYFYMGLCYEALGDTANAMICWDKLIYQEKSYETEKSTKSQNDNFFSQRALLAKAQSNFLKGNSYEAMRQYEEALDVFSLNAVPYVCIQRLFSLYKKYRRTTSMQNLKDQVLLEMKISINDTIGQQESSSSKYYTLQVGAFQVYQNALDLKSRLRKKGFDAFCIKILSQKGPVYKVKVGRCVARSQLKTLQKKIWRKARIRGTMMLGNVSLS
ncbi:hypothetical protein AB834_00185 [PVC group bacterium (ex Bugula neritina AB1)]|nr:hypothetical protein AB834_00185 [PVC group bacterium (ex Bugula neritina AB1)]